MNKIRPLIFLDIDGVLNPHNYQDGDISSTVILLEHVGVLNMILKRTDAEVVLSSAWRYMIPRDVTLKGFEYLLRSHGAAIKDRLIGYTCRDERIPLRGDQITDALQTWGGRPYVVLDDGGTNRETGEWTDMGIDAAGHPVVWIEGSLGLQYYHTNAVLEVLRLQGWEEP